MRESMAIDWRVDLTNESCMINDIALQDHEEAWRRKPITGCLLNLTPLLKHCGLEALQVFITPECPRGS